MTSLCDQQKTNEPFLKCNLCEEHAGNDFQSRRKSLLFDVKQQVVAVKTVAKKMFEDVCCAATSFRSLLQESGHPSVCSL